MLFAAAFAHALSAAGVATETGSVDLGIAVAIHEGLVVPVLRNADQLALQDLARGIAELADRARRRSLGAEDMRGAVATLSNVGSFGNLTAFPIIPVGQVCILAPGSIESRPVPGPGGSIHKGSSCLIALVFDRRAFSELGADRLLRSVGATLRGLAIGPFAGRP